MSNYSNEDQAAERIRQDKQKLAIRLEYLANQVDAHKWKPPLALEELLLSGKVKDVISLNVDLVLEKWLVNYDSNNVASNKKRPSKKIPKACNASTVEGKVKNNQGELNRSRQRQFTIKVNEEEHSITFWYPHGDSQNYESLQFSMNDYAASLGWMDQARQAFKQRERAENFCYENLSFETWLDPFLTKKQILILGSSLDKAEWDIWGALLYRFRNFTRHEVEDWYPTTKILTCKDHHAHVPDSYIEKIQGCTYEAAWCKLQNEYCVDTLQE